MSYRDLSFPHDAVCSVSILFVLLGLVVTLLIAEEPQGLRALQLDLKLLLGKGKKKKRETILSLKHQAAHIIQHKGKKTKQHCHCSPTSLPSMLFII